LKPFHVALKIALLAPLLLFGAAYLVPEGSEIANFDAYLFGIPIVVELVAVPVAIYFLLRREYLTIANLLMTLVATIPLAFLIMVATYPFEGAHL
jgi:uncharacterized paraquat-inducible protein A